MKRWRAEFRSVLAGAVKRQSFKIERAQLPVIPSPRIGASEVVSLIGAGGMGEVYRAR